MVSLNRFLNIRESYGHVASWAVWAKEGDTPKSGMSDLSVLDPTQNPALLDTVHGEAVFLGLNISRRIERPFGNFHDRRPMATDFKIRHALKGTRFWGAYMTDLIKDFEEKASANLVQYLRTNRDFEAENIALLKAELQLLGAHTPTLIAFGKDTEKIAKRTLGKDFPVIGIPHYAIYISKENYRSQVLQILDTHIQ